jgi:hypothetical protein
MKKSFLSALIAVAMLAAFVPQTIQRFTDKAVARIKASVEYFIIAPLFRAVTFYGYRTGFILFDNSFSKEERVAFEDVLEKFNDAQVLSRNVSKYQADAVTMERSSNVIWRPMPYIAQSHDGTDATANFDRATQLSVPATIGYSKHSTAILTATELLDLLQENRLGEAAVQKLSSDINVSCMSIAALQGTLVVKRTTAAAGFDDVAQCEAIMNEQGVNAFERYLALSTRDYNGMASNLAAVTRSFGNQKSDKAYEKAYVGPVASFETYKLDYANRLAAAGGGGSITMDTRDSASNYYTPKATSTAATTGETSNVDNRYQTITVSSTTSVAAGDCFTVAALDAVHHITKGDTGQLKTFRVMSVPSSTTLVISPPMITAQGNTDAELQYQELRDQHQGQQLGTRVLEHRGGFDQPVLAEGCNRDLAGPVCSADRCRRRCHAR